VPVDPPQAEEYSEFVADGHGHFAMVETNRKEVFNVIRGWIESNVLGSGPALRQTASG
jgi:hypothetical protein